MSNYFKKLNLTDTPLKKEYKFPIHLCTSLKSPTYAYVPEKFISNELNTQLQDVGLEISGIVLFKKLPGYSNPLHTDVVLDGNKWIVWHAAINWDLTDAESIMEWYSSDEKEIWPKVVESDQPYLLSGIHYGFLGNKDTSSMHLLESTKITVPTLVRTDVPHQIKNLDNKDRWCLSIRFTINYTWVEIVKILTQYCRHQD